MTIKKMVIVPAEGIIEKWPENPAISFFVRTAKYVKRKARGIGPIYDSEIQRYSDIPKILGAENVFILGEFYNHLHDPAIPEFCPHPSCHGTPRAQNITEKEIPSTLQAVDAVLVSAYAGYRGAVVAAEAKKRNIPVAMIDVRDHPSNYGAADVAQKLCRGFIKGTHYDMYFKNDLPLGCKTDSLLPLAPCPVRLESYQFNILPKKYDFFFSGKTRSTGQADSEELNAFVKNNFQSALILEYKVRGRFLTTKEYWDNLAQSKIALSPSRIVWDSFRHCETALAHETALIAPKPYVETTGPALKDGVNAILYDTEFRNSKYHLNDHGTMKEKIRQYLDHPEERKRIADRWAADVQSGHTVYARSKYIIESMENAFAR